MYRSTKGKEKRETRRKKDRHIQKRKTIIREGRSRRKERYREKKNRKKEGQIEIRNRQREKQREKV
jgi:hypothetical protein